MKCLLISFGLLTIIVTSFLISVDYDVCVIEHNIIML